MTRLATIEQAAAGFEPVADSLREAVLADYRSSGAELKGVPGFLTLETNSGLAARRANSLLVLLARHEPELDLDGLRLLDVGCGFGSLAVYLGVSGGRDRRNRHQRPAARGRTACGARVRAPGALDPGFPSGAAAARSMHRAGGAQQFALLRGAATRAPDWRRSRSPRAAPGRPAVVRNPNGTAVLDPFTGLPGLNRLPPRAAQASSRVIGRHRSHVRLLSAPAQRAELVRFGFDVLDIRAVTQRTVKAFDRWVASYQHVLARRPAAG